MLFRSMLGFNYRMSEIHAAIGICQLDKVPAFLEARQANYAALQSGLAELPELKLFESTRGDFQSSYYCMSALLSERLRSKRFDVVDSLRRRGVGTSVYYPRAVPHMTYYRERYGHGEDSYPVARMISESSIALPVGPHVTVEDMNYIVDAMKTAIHEVR